MLKPNIITVLLFLIIFSCNNSQTKYNKGPFLDEYKIIKEGTIELDVNDSVSNFIISFEYLDKSEFNLQEDIIVAHDWPAGSLNFFSVTKKQLVKKLKFETEGPRKIGPVLNGFHLKSMDSIMTVGGYFFSIVNSDGEPYFQHNLMKNNDGLTALPQINNGASIVEHQHKIYMNTAPDISTLQPESFRGKQCVKILNLNNKNVTTEVEYPSIYRKGAFGPNYAPFYQAFNPSNLDIVFSFPADHNLYTAKINDIRDIKSIWGGSKFIKSISPMERRFPENDDFQYYTRFYVQNPSYGHIFYDKYRELYYRVAYRPVTDERYIDGVRWKPKSLIIFDKDLSRRGEVELPENTNPSCIEPTKDGVLIDTGGGNENKLIFTLFKVVRK